jgi:hypothetical protein
MLGPVGSPYPGTPIALSCLGFIAAGIVSHVLSARETSRGVTHQRGWVAAVAAAIVHVMAAVVFLSIAWTMWTHR